MDFTSAHFMNDLLLFFEQHCITGFLALQPYAWQLITLLGIIDICATWTLYTGQLRMTEVIIKIMKIALFMFFIINFDKINSAILLSFQYAGLTASGQSLSTHLIQPSSILDLGFQACDAPMKSLFKASWYNCPTMAADLVYIILTMIAFFGMALMVLVTKIEFNVFATVAVILLPFGALRFTQFLFQRVVSAVFSYGIKLMIMYFILGLFKTLLDTNITPAFTDSSNPEFAEMLRYAFEYLTMAFLMWQMPQLASGFMQGQPAMEGITAASGAKSAAGAAVGVASGGVSKAGSLAGYARAISAHNTEGTWKGALKTMAKERIGNSSAGSSYYNAGRNLENFKNLNEMLTNIKDQKPPK